MRESCMSGSVRGASSDRRLYSTPRPAAVSRPPLSRSLWLAPPVLTGLPWFGWFPIDLARRNPRECWIPVPIAAPIGPYKISPPFSGLRKSPTAAGIRAAGLGVHCQNVTANLSPNAGFSPKLGAWPIHSTSFFVQFIRDLASFTNRKVGIPIACCS